MQLDVTFILMEKKNGIDLKTNHVGQKEQNEKVVLKTCLNVLTRTEKDRKK